MNTNEEKKMDVVRDQALDQVNAGSAESLDAVIKKELGSKAALLSDVLATVNAGGEIAALDKPAACSTYKAKAMDEDALGEIIAGSTGSNSFEKTESSKIISKVIYDAYDLAQVNAGAATAKEAELMATTVTGKA